MSPDALALMAALDRSRTEETPGRITGRGTTTTPRMVPIMPGKPSSGVSRDQIQARLRKWGIDWDIARVTAAVRECVAAGRVYPGPKGFYSRRVVKGIDECGGAA